jgi:hypothetical protein
VVLILNLSAPPLRLCDPFGLTVSGAARYTAFLEHPAWPNNPAR